MDDRIVGLRWQLVVDEIGLGSSSGCSVVVEDPDREFDMHWEGQLLHSMDPQYWHEYFHGSIEDHSHGWVGLHLRCSDRSSASSNNFHFELQHHHNDLNADENDASQQREVEK